MSHLVSLKDKDATLYLKASTLAVCSWDFLQAPIVCSPHERAAVGLKTSNLDASTEKGLGCFILFPSVWGYSPANTIRHRAVHSTNQSFSLLLGD